MFGGGGRGYETGGCGAADEETTQWEDAEGGLSEAFDADSRRDGAG